MGGARRELAGAAGVGAALLVYLITRSALFALLCGLGVGIAVAASGRPSAAGRLDMGRERQQVLEADPLVNFVPPGSQRVELSSSAEWASILEGGTDRNAWVRRRLLVDTEPATAIASFATEAERLGWTVEELDEEHGRFKRANGSTSDLVKVGRTGHDLSVIATVVD